MIMVSTTLQQPLEKLKIFSIKGTQMRTFHISWMTFFLCFFGWFGIAPLMPAIRTDLGLTNAQVANTIIASVSATVVARLLIGRLCDRWGARKTYTLLLILCAIPVIFIGVAHTYTSFLLFRLAIGVVGASFVVTQFHTSLMFAPRIKGTANAVAGGWGNLGGGVTNMIMPLIFSALLGLGYTSSDAWRYAMILPGILLLLMAFVYYRFTRDTPAGNYDELNQRPRKTSRSDWKVLYDRRIWALTLAYAVSFGMEITFDNVAALHFTDTFKLPLTIAGLLAGMFGFMNIFARALGGIFADNIGQRHGMRGKGLLLSAVLLLEGAGILLFASCGSLVLAVITMLLFALFLKMANGCAYAMVPFINEKNIGLVSGFVGAGGNIGGMLFGFLFKGGNMSYAEAFTTIGIIVITVAVIVFFTKFKTTAAANGGKTLPAERTIRLQLKKKDTQKTHAVFGQK